MLTTIVCHVCSDETVMDDDHVVRSAQLIAFLAAHGHEPAYFTLKRRGATAGTETREQ